jgi:hypothetical protein
MNPGRRSETDCGNGRRVKVTQGGEKEGMNPRTMMDSGASVTAPCRVRVVGSPGISVRSDLSNVPATGRTRQDFERHDYGRMIGRIHMESRTAPIEAFKPSATTPTKKLESPRSSPWWAWPWGFLNTLQLQGFSTSKSLLGLPNSAPIREEAGSSSTDDPETRSLDGDHHDMDDSSASMYLPNTMTQPRDNEDTDWDANCRHHRAIEPSDCP